MKSSLLNGALPDRRPCTISMAELVVGFPTFFFMIYWSYLPRSSFSITIGIWFYVPFGICKKNVLNEINHVYDLSSFDFR